MEKTARDRIVEAATRLFAEKGFGGVSLPDIAAAAKVASGEASKLFSNEARLYETVLETQFGLYASRMKAALVGEKSSEDKIGLMAKAVCELHEQTPHFFPLFYRELLNPSPFFETIVKKNIRHVAYLSDNNIARGIQKGIFKYEINPANATMLLLGMFHYNFLASQLHETLLPEPGNDAEYLDQVLKVFLTGIKKKKG